MLRNIIIILLLAVCPALSGCDALWGVSTSVGSDDGTTYVAPSVYNPYYWNGGIYNPGWGWGPAYYPGWGNTVGYYPQPPATRPGVIRPGIVRPGWGGASGNIRPANPAPTPPAGGTTGGQGNIRPAGSSEPPYINLNGSNPGPAIIPETGRH